MPRNDRWQAAWHIGDAAVRDAALWHAWEEVRRRAVVSHVFHRPDLLRAWYDTVGRACGATPALGEFDGPHGARVWLAACITPYRGRFVTRAICEPAGQELFGYQDPVSTHLLDAPSWDAFWSTVRVTLADRGDVGLFRFVRPELAGTQWAEPAGDASPVLSVAGARTLDDVLARCSPNHRGDVRRRLRRLEERGPVTLHVFDGDGVAAARDELRGAFMTAWRTRHESGTARPGLSAYCERLIADGLREAFCHFSVVRVGDTPVAWHLGLGDAGRLYWWMPAHDDAWDAYSPGKVLLALLIEWLARHEWRELHFQTGRQAYKLAWRPDEPALTAVRWHAPGVKGRLLAGYDMARAR